MSRGEESSWLPKSGPTQKGILFDVMEEALSDAGYYATTAIVVTQRDLYYSARELYFSHPYFPEVEAKQVELYRKKGKTKAGGAAAISYDYFTQNILVEWEAEHGKLERLIRDVRGHLYEPHSGQEMEIGTLSMLEYDFPELVFNKLLYIEKEGEMGKVREARLAEKYDMAILTGKGFPTEAIRNLLSAASDAREYQVFVFHDADHSGYDIARTLREETKRMPGYSVEVVDLGLTVEDAEDMGLAGEQYTRQKALPEPLIPHLTPRAFEVLEGEKTGRNVWSAHRYELNSIKPPQRRIEYIEEKLLSNGASRKVIPGDDRLQSQIRARRNRDIRMEIERAVEQLVDLDSLVSDLTPQFRDAYGLDNPGDLVTESFRRNPYQSWRQVIERHVQRASPTEEIEAAVEDAVRHRMEGE